MDKKSLEEYLKKLEHFESILGETDEDNIDEDFMKEVSDTLNNLSVDSMQHVQEASSNNNQYLGSSMEYKVNCKIKKLHPDAKIPKYSKDGDACVDLHTVGYTINEFKNQITYSTGISIEMPTGYVGLVFPRSSIGRTRLFLSNSVGVIDSGYRGEIVANFNMTNSQDTTIYETGERICQLMILPYPKIEFTEVDELSSSERGEGGFGSTGK